MMDEKEEEFEMTEDLAREVAGRLPGARYSEEEVRGAIAWARNAMAREIGDEINIAPDCIRCRHPLSTHPQNQPCQAEEVMAAEPFVARQLTRLRDAIAIIDMRDNRTVLLSRNHDLKRQIQDHKVREEEQNQEIARLRSEMETMRRSEGAEFIIHANEADRLDKMEKEADQELGNLVVVPAIGTADHTYNSINGGDR